MLTLKTLRGAGLLVFSRLLGRAIDFVALLILARILSPSDFGLVALAMTLIAIVDIIFELPVTQALTRLPHIERSHLDTAFTIGLIRGLLIASALVAAALPFAAAYGDPQLVAIIAALAISPVTKAFYSPAMVNFIRDVNFKQVFLAELAGKLSAFGMAIVAVLLGAGYWALVLNFVVAGFVSTVLSYLFAPYRPVLTLEKFRDFAGFMGWFSAAQVIGAINWQFDRLLLGANIDKATLGRYAMASDLAVMPTQSLIGPAMQPVMAAFSLMSGDPCRRATAFLKATRYAMLISAPTCVGIALTSDLIVAVLLGPRWIEAGPMLRWLALTVLAVPYFQTIYALALAMDRPKIVFRLNCIDLVLRVIAMPIFFFAFALPGVIGARGVVALLMCFMFVLQARHLVGVSLVEQWRNVRKICYATILLALAVLIWRSWLDPMHWPPLLELLACMLWGCAVYAACLWILGMRLAWRSGHFELTER